MNPDWCIHRTSLSEPKCLAGVSYEEMWGSAPGIVHRCACIRTNATTLQCPKAEFPTPEQLAASKAGISTAFGKFAAALLAIREHTAIERTKSGNIKKMKVGRGKMPCPICGSELHYSIAPNQHVHAMCAREGCVSFIQ